MASRRADTFNGGDPSQCGKALGRESSQGFPCAFEFVKFRDQTKEFGGNIERAGLYHTRLHTRNHPICQATNTPVDPSA